MKKTNSLKLHEPVMVDEVISLLKVKKNAHLKQVIIDATIGFAGHSVRLVERGVKVLGIDEDKEALKVARERLEKACPPHLENKVGRYTLVHSNFRGIDQIANKNHIYVTDAILFDLGVNTSQLMSPIRGFSFSNPDSKLDMRLNPDNQAVSAAMLLNVLSKKQLTELFEVVIDRKNSLKLAKNVVERRKEKEFALVSDLLDLLPKKSVNDKVHPATLAFMALRIAVNNELDNLKEALPKAIDLLQEGGRLVVISFHSGEDKIVKELFREFVEQKKAKWIVKKPLSPSAGEIKENPRSRSAKLRAIEKKGN